MEFYEALYEEDFPYLEQYLLESNHPEEFLEIVLNHLQDEIRLELENFQDPYYVNRKREYWRLFRLILSHPNTLIEMENSPVKRKIIHNLLGTEFHIGIYMEDFDDFYTRYQSRPRLYQRFLNRAVNRLTDEDLI